jgi:hypothetical protein
MILKSKLVAMLLLSSFILIFTNTASAHCDSYDGPVIKDAEKALETNNVNLVLKWVSKEQEKEITPLFQKTYELQNGDKQVYEIVRKHFFESLVRLHRETEGAPYTGLKPAGTTKPIIQMTDKALNENNVDDFLQKLNNHIDKVVREKFNKVSELNKVKDDSVEKGREFVAAYVDYTHTVEAIHDIIEHGASSHEGH